MPKIDPYRSTSIDIRPEVNILGVLRHLNYKPWFALAEYVDNSLASYLTMKTVRPAIEPLQIEIIVESTNGGTIIIRDNAYGISIADFPRAFKAAEVPPDTRGLSEFGMGMKSASSWFARRWRVRTSTEGDPFQRAITFDLDNIVERNTAELPIHVTPANPSSHYTVIELECLNHSPQGRTLGKIKTHLASIYRKFLRSGDLNLTFNGERILYQEVEVLKAKSFNDPHGPDIIWQSDDIAIDMGYGRKITGFAAIRSKGSTSEAGFALFRRGRVIQGSHDDTYRPVEVFGRSTTHVYQRLFGELEFEGFDVSHTKDVIEWGGVEEEFLAMLKKFLRSSDPNIMEQAIRYRHKYADAEDRNRIERASVEVTSLVEKTLSKTVQSVQSVPVYDGQLASSLERVVQSVDVKLSPVQSTIAVRTERDLWVVTLESTLDDTGTEWIDISDAKEDIYPITGQACRTLRIRLSFAHPFVRKFSGPSGDSNEVILAIGSAIGIAASLGQDANLKPKALIQLLNMVLRGSFTPLESEQNFE